MRPSEALDHHRQTIRDLPALFRGSNLRVFGSVARGTDTERSDLDLLVDMDPEASLLDLSELKLAIQDRLGVRVDLVTPGCFGEALRAQVLAQARPV